MSQRPLHTLVLGGARSGKSQFAESLVPESGCTYLATARPYPSEDGGQFDADFAARIARHAARRPANWVLDEHTDLIDALNSPIPAHGNHLFVDDLGTWLTHKLDLVGWEGQRGQFSELFEQVVRGIAKCESSLTIVSPEVGMGVIPEHPAGRLFRDELGALNQLVAQHCDRVLLVVAGQTLTLKSP